MLVLRYLDGVRLDDDRKHRGHSVAEAQSFARGLVDRINTRAQPGGEKLDDMQRALLATVREFPARAGCAALPWLTLEAALANRPNALLAP